VYAFSNIALFTVSEYRYPAAGALVIFSALGMHGLVKLYTLKKIKMLVAALTGLSVLFFISNADIYASVFGLRSYKAANLANSYFGLGYTFEENNMFAEAVNAYKKSIAIMPQDGSLVNLSRLYSRTGNVIEAEQMLVWAVRLKPNAYEGRNNLGSLFYNQGKYENALAEFEIADKLYPYSQTVKNNILMAQKALQGAPIQEKNHGIR
jgi:tetratricopeptide (TPR) repeat protein